MSSCLFRFTSCCTQVFLLLLSIRLVFRKSFARKSCIQFTWHRFRMTGGFGRKWIRWWFQTFFIFSPTWGNDQIWLYNMFQMGWNHKLVKDFFQPWHEVFDVQVPFISPHPFRIFVSGTIATQSRCALFDIWFFWGMGLDECHVPVLWLCFNMFFRGLKWMVIHMSFWSDIFRGRHAWLYNALYTPFGVFVFGYTGHLDSACKNLEGSGIAWTERWCFFRASRSLGHLGTMYCNCPSFEILNKREFDKTWEPSFGIFTPNSLNIFSLK